MFDLDENNIDDEPFDGETSIQEAGDTASDNANMRAVAEYQRNNLDPEPKSDLERHTERLAPLAPAVAPAPPAAGLPLETVERMIERVVEKVVPRPAPAPVAPPPPPEPTLVEQFDRDEAFYRAAMQQAGFEPDKDGKFTREGMMAVRAQLRLADREKEWASRFEAAETQRSNDAMMQVARSIEARLGAFEPLSAMQQRSFARAVGELLQGGHQLPEAMEAVVREFSPMLRQRAAPAPAAPARGQVTRRAPTAADRIIATPGMNRAGQKPNTTPEDRLQAARRAMAEKLTTRRR